MGEITCNFCKRPLGISTKALYTDHGFIICEHCIEAAYEKLVDIRANGNKPNGMHRE